MPVIEPYRDAQFDGVDALWRRVFPEDPPHSRPDVVIAAKKQVQPDLFLVATDGGHVVGTILAGYDGHRGWLYKLAVHPNARQCGIGRDLVRAAEARLAAMGCIKINLQVRLSNQDVAAFWKRMGYDVEPIVSMGRKLA